jgi:hypothetical protein
VGRSREFSLLIECCRWAFAGGDPDHVRDLEAGVFWPAFLSLARFHRVQALVWHCLRTLDVAVPSGAAETLDVEAKRIAATNLRMAVECRRLLESFSERRIPLLFLKGLSVAALAYRDPFLKMSWDIDVLIAPTDLNGASEVLFGDGYQLTTPRRTALPAWHEREKESVWKKMSEGFTLELHTRLADNRRLVPEITTQSPSQDVEIAPGTILPTLGPDELFAYLCVHGASSAWFRLKWVTDLAALLHAQRPQEIGRLYRRSQELGAGRAPAQALLLADALYGTLDSSPGLKGELERGRSNCLLFRAALAELGGQADPVEPTQRALGTATIHWTQLFLRPGIGFKASELARQVRRAFARF